ncbi:hypothetical protein GNP10_14625 [Escherichia coli]|nr:hypothetical protein [Escherichia coli]
MRSLLTMVADRRYYGPWLRSGTARIASVGAMCSACWLFCMTAGRVADVGLRMQCFGDCHAGVEICDAVAVLRHGCLSAIWAMIRTGKQCSTMGRILRCAVPDAAIRWWCAAQTGSTRGRFALGVKWRCAGGVCGRIRWLRLLLSLACRWRWALRGVIWRGCLLLESDRTFSAVGAVSARMWQLELAAAER